MRGRGVGKKTRYLKGCLRHMWAAFVRVHTMSENNLERCLSDLLAFYPEWAFYCSPLCPAAQTMAIYNTATHAASR